MSASKCASCRHSFIRALLSFTDVHSRAVLKPTTTKLSYDAFNPFNSIRPFTLINPRRSDNAQQDSVPPINIRNENQEDEEHSAPTQDIPEPLSQQPWYLQDQTPPHELRPLSERQQLPEIPPDPPPLLQPILEHISLDLGLDDLSLFDLRTLDPPPALGANLLMILGTARSEKHLHVSADRFCRWLRSEHKLTPSADGLMGRGELKLKMKRKNRRARILSRVGSSERYKQDDGLTTGWICVNVGSVEDGKGASAEVLGHDGFAGFGEKFGEAKIVIQMLTEEKRTELDLEEFWEDILKSHERKEAKIKASSEVTMNDSPPDRFSLQEQNLSSTPSSIVLANHQKPLVGNYQQRRKFYSSASYLQSDHISQKMAEDLSINTPHMDAEKNTERKLSFEYHDSRYELIESENAAGNSESAKAEKLVLDQKLLGLKASLAFLRSLKGEDAIEALGTGIKDWNSTAFLASFYESYPLFPREDHWKCRLAMVCHAIRIGHPGYSKRNLMLLVHQMRATIVYLPSSIALIIIETLLSRDTTAQSDKSPIIGYSFKFWDLQNSLTLLDLMDIHDVDDHFKKILTILYAAIACVSESDLTWGLRSNVTTLLRMYMDIFGITSMDTETHLIVLNTLALKNNWEAFWDHWNGIARRLKPKPAELYALMFHRVAETRSQIQCIDALRNGVTEMKLEEPPVRLVGEVAKAVMECLRVVAPDLESGIVNRNWRPEARWVHLWEICEYSTRHPDLTPAPPSTSNSEGIENDNGLALSY